MRLYVGEDGASGGGEDEDGGGNNLGGDGEEKDDGDSGAGDSDIGNLIPDDLSEEEKAFRQSMIKNQEIVKDDQISVLDDEADDDLDGGDDNISGDNSSDKTGEDDSGDADGELVFDDNILEGLAGEDMAKLPENVQGVVAETRVEIDKLKDEIKQQKELFERVEKDPIAKDRVEKIKSGNETQLYESPGLTDKQADKLFEFAEDEDKEAFKAEMEQIVKAQVQSGLSNERITDEQKRTYSDDLKESGQILLDAMKLNPDFVIKETDPLAIAKITDSHGEYSTYMEGIGKVVQHINKMASKNIITDVRKYVKNLGPKGLYALGAEKFGWPVVMNADDKINNQIKDKVRQAVRLFQKPKGVAGPVASKISSVSKKKINDTFDSDGINAKKLATDGKYHQQILNQKWGDQEWLKHVSTLRVKGEKLLAQEKNG